MVDLNLMGNREVRNLDEQLSVVSNKNVIYQFMDTKFASDLKIKTSDFIRNSKGMQIVVVNLVGTCK